MSSSSSPALVLELPSAHLALFSSLGMLLVALLLVTLMNQGWVSGLMRWWLLSVPASAALSLWQAGYWHPARRLQKLTWQQQGDCLLQFADGEVVVVQLSAASWVTPWLWCLRFESPARKVPPAMVWRGQFPIHTWQLWRTRLYLQGAAMASRAEPHLG